MTEDDLDIDDLEVEEKKKKKGGKTESTGAERAKAPMSDAMREMMVLRGFTLQQITDMIKNWRHLDAKEVAMRLAEFSSDIARASAHIVVSFTKDAGHALVHNFLRHCRHLASLVRNLTPDDRRRIDHNINFG